MIGALLDSPTMNPNTPGGLQSRLIFYLSMKFCLRACRQLHQMLVRDFTLVTLPATHLEYPGYVCLTFLENLTKTNQGRSRQALLKKTRENPFVLLPPGACPDNMDDLVCLFRMYRSKCPPTPKCDKMFLAPIANEPAVRLSPFVMRLASLAVLPVFFLTTRARRRPGHRHVCGTRTHRAVRARSPAPSRSQRPISLTTSLLPTSAASQRLARCLSPTAVAA